MFNRQLFYQEQVLLLPLMHLIWDTGMQSMDARISPPIHYSFAIICCSIKPSHEMIFIIISKPMQTNQTIFDKIIRKQIPSSIVYEDEHVLAFRDINPQAPVHVLIIPKVKDGLVGISNAEERHQQILGKMMVAVAKVGQLEKLDEGYRVVVNNGKHGGQEVPHLHIHVLGGKQCTWPPGTSK